MDYEVINLSEAPRELASAPFETHERMTQIAMAEKPKDFIADMVMPIVNTAYKFKYTLGENDDQFSMPEDRASRSGRLTEIEFGAELATGSTEDRGFIAYVPYRDIAEAQQQQSAWDPLAQASMGLGQMMSLRRERRVADIVANANNYGTGLSATLAGNAQWSHAESDPVTAILEAMDKCITRPNSLVMGQDVWTKLRRHPHVVESVLSTGAGAGAVARTTAEGGGRGAQASGIVMKRAVAELFELENLWVGSTWYQSANRGQTASYSRLWGKFCAALHIRRPSSSQDAMPTWGFTAQAMSREIAMSEEPTRGVGRGSRAIKISESCNEIVSWKTAGYLWKAAVA